MGIIADLSEWQGNVDFAKLSKAVDGVILRVQAGYTHTDSKYKEYVAGCKANNVPFGTYAYFKGISVPDAIAEAKHALSLMDKVSKCFALDIEEVTCSNLAAAGQAFVDYLKNQGVKNVGLYSGEYFYTSHNLSAIKADWHWIANYGADDGKPHNAPKVSDDLWQFTSVGRLSGIAGNVDESKVAGRFNFFAGDHTIVSLYKKPIQVVKVLNPSDIREDASHTSGFIRNAQLGEIFNVWERKENWHKVIANVKTGQTGWIDGAGGHNLSWIDNPALKQAAQPVYYTIQSGDTLSQIAAANGTTVSQLQVWNGIKNPDLIAVGQILRVK